MAYSNNDPKPFTSERITGEGNLCADPKLISSAGKTTTVVLRVAANSRSIDKNGNVVEGVQYRNIKVFGWKAEGLLDTLKKGDMVFYDGALSPTSFENTKTGETQMDEEIIHATVGQIPRSNSNGSSRSRRDDDDEDEAPRKTRSRSRRDDDDEDEAPRKTRSRSRRDDDDEDDNDIDDLEEAKPKRRSRRAADAEEYTEDLL